MCGLDPVPLPGHLVYRKFPLNIYTVQILITFSFVAITKHIDYYNNS